jgi:hypothetical protein
VNVEQCGGHLSESQVMTIACQVKKERYFQHKYHLKFVADIFEKKGWT